MRLIFFLNLLFSHNISYGSIKAELSKRHAPGEGLTGGEHFGAALGAGIFTTIATNPLGVMRTHLVMEKKEGRGQKSALKMFSAIWKHEGLSGMYKGIGANVLGVSHGAVQLLIYEKIKERIVDEGKDPVSDIILIYYF